MYIYTYIHTCICTRKPFDRQTTSLYTIQVFNLPGNPLIYKDILEYTRNSCNTIMFHDTVSFQKSMW